MKILAIDDQQLVLLPLQKRLETLGYQVVTETNAENAITLFNTFKPDLVIVDINMPIISGLDIVKHVKQSSRPNAFVIVLSGNTDDAVISAVFNLGVNHYLKKPLSLNEVCVRVKHLLGAPKPKLKLSKNSIIIQKRCVGVVIPCYNEALRLSSDAFLNFISKYSGYHLCFVNDGSTDNTLHILQDLQKDRSHYITVYNCEKNGGKAEAVRLGMLHMAKQKDLDFIGFLDADLSTNLQDFDNLVKTLESSNFKIVSGSRMHRMGANITKASARRLISYSINVMIRKILKMDFNDTQCGAKIFKKEVIDVAFNKKFVTQWIFDVEIFKRIAIHYGLKKAKTMLCEQPLKRWVHADGSKLSFKDSFKIVGQLMQIAWVYKL